MRVEEGRAADTVHGAGCKGVTGYVPEDYAADHGLWLRMVPEEDRRAVLEQAARSLKGVETQPLEHRIQHRDGSLHWVRNTHVLRKDERGVPLSYDGVVVDITARKTAEEEVLASERRYRWLMEHSSDVTGVFDKGGTITYVSPSIERLLGYTPREVQGSVLFALPIHPEDIPKTREFFDGVLARPGQTATADFRFQHKDGSWRILEALGNNLLGDPEVSGVLLNIRDISEKRNLEARFLRAQRMESIGVLAGGIAHDLNNVLTPILLTIEVLRAKMPQEDVGRFLDTLQNSAQRGSDMIQQVLSFARGAEGHSLMIQPRHLILEVAKIIKQTLPKSIEVRERVPRDLWCVTGDPTHLHQVLMNICVNARDAMPEGGRLEIAAENVEIDQQYCSQEPDARPGPHLVIIVADTGTGIPPEVLEHMFEPFFTTKELGKGTGLGLATVLGIVKSHGGFVTVASQVGRGTTFRIHLPAHKSALPTPVAEAGAGAETGHGELILVVDDEEAVREMTRAALEAQGYRVLTATAGREAVVAYAARSM